MITEEAFGLKNDAWYQNFQENLSSLEKCENDWLNTKFDFKF